MSTEEQVSAYKEKFLQVEAALKLDPENEELLQVRADLLEVIHLAEDVLKIKKKPGVNPHSSSVDESYHSPIKSSLSNTSVTESARTVETEYGGEEDEGMEGDEEFDEDGTTETGNSTFKIPKSLKILPTDSEEVRNSKRKRIRAIKSQHRKKRMEEDRNTRKSAWQEFTQGSSKKVKTGSSTGQKKQSIFRSPDTVEGKVGVTGSGNKPTPQPIFKATEVERVKRVKYT